MPVTVLEKCVRGGMPVLLLVGRAGGSYSACGDRRSSGSGGGRSSRRAWSTSMPFQKGIPAIFGTWPFVSDLRTGAMSGGSVRTGVAFRGLCTDVPFLRSSRCGAAAGIADSKMPDVQTGYEKGITNVMAGLSGPEYGVRVGRYACFAAGVSSLESLIIDNDMLGQCLRCVRGDGSHRRHVIVPGSRLPMSVHERSGSFSRPRADACPDADGIHLPAHRRPHEPEGMG